MDPSNLQDNQGNWRVGGDQNQIFCGTYFLLREKAYFVTGSNLMDCNIAEVEEQLKSNQKAEAMKLLV